MRSAVRSLPGRVDSVWPCSVEFMGDISIHSKSCSLSLLSSWSLTQINIWDLTVNAENIHARSGGSFVWNILHLKYFKKGIRILMIAKKIAFGIPTLVTSLLAPNEPNLCISKVSKEGLERINLYGTGILYLNHCCLHYEQVMWFLS